VPVAAGVFDACGDWLPVGEFVPASLGLHALKTVNKTITITRAHARILRFDIFFPPVLFM